MKELALVEQYEVCGGVAIGTTLLYLLLGTAIYRLYKSKKGRVYIPYVLRLEWSN